MLEYRFAILAAFATFALLLIGGTVNPTGSSLACPEPTLVCNGELFPAMKGGVLYEHGHRLAAMTVGFLQIGLTVLLWRRRKSLKWLGVAALVMVCVQGTLGAITVEYELPTAVSVTHLMVAFVYFATLIYIAWRTRPGAEVAPGLGRIDLGRARKWVLLACGAVLAQIFLGAMVRHTGAALACLDLPLCGGDVLPAADTPTPLAVHMLHRVVGAIAGVIVVWASIAVYRAARGHRLARRLALAAPVVVLAQIALGILTIYTLRSTPIAVAHFGGAAVLWGIWFGLALISWPRRARSAERSPAPELAGEGAA